MNRVAFITRSTLATVPGGDTVQVMETAKGLARYGIHADIFPADARIDYALYDLLHFFNINRPADMLVHIRRAGKPYVVSPVYINYSGYDRYFRKGAGGWLLSKLDNHHAEYTKNIARWLRGADKLVSKEYIWKGHRGSVKEILRNASMLLPNSLSEMERIGGDFSFSGSWCVVPNGVDEDVFDEDGHPVQKDPLMVVCAARIEGIKNQLHLIRALNDTPYQLFLIGAHAPNQRGYYRECRKLASGNIHFIGRIPQQEVKAYYRRAKVHVLPSWFETTGLSSLEAAAMGCQVVITHYGDAHEYFSQDAFYCDPSSPASIRQAVEEAAAGGDTVSLRQRIHSHYTWEKATRKTYEAYRMVLHS